MPVFHKPPCDDGVIAGGPSAAATPASGRWVLVAAVLGSSMVFIDSSVVNVALPTVQEDLRASAAATQWTVESYALSLAALLPLVLLMFALSRWSGGLIASFGAKPPLVVGPLIAAVGFGLFAIPGIAGSYWTTWFPAVTVLGIGMAITVAPLTTAVMGAVDQQRAGIASGINNSVARTASLPAIAVLGIAVSLAFGNQLESRLDEAPLDVETRTAMRDQAKDLAAAEAPATVDEATRATIVGIVDRSFLAAFRVVMLIAAALAIASAVCARLPVAGVPDGVIGWPPTERPCVVPWVGVM
ncbi:MAG: MFS transporter [Chloroflexia bacterium]|nr:MFS transporter [Chloroflexia bacterium]